MTERKTMNKKLLLASIIACSLSCLSLTVYAADEHNQQDNAEQHSDGQEKQIDADSHADEEMEHHDPHEHGTAKLSLATTEKGFEIILDTPAVNVFGFEYVASTDEQKQQLKIGKDKLSAGGDLFVANTEAGCSLQTVELNSLLLKDDKADSESNSVHSADHADSDNHSDHQTEQTDSDNHGDHDHPADHADVDGNWSFSCENLDKLTEVKVNLFSQFPDGFKRLDVEWLTEAGASAKTITQDEAIELK